MTGVQTCALPICPAAARDELVRFHDRLFDAYRAEMGGNAVFRMKEHWSYLKFAFADPLRAHRAVRKVRTVDDYRAAVQAVFSAGELAEVMRFGG